MILAPGIQLLGIKILHNRDAEWMWFSFKRVYNLMKFFLSYTLSNTLDSVVSRYVSAGNVKLLKIVTT